MTDRPRLGQIPYLNSLPFQAGLHATGAIDHVEPVTGTPVELARLLHEGALDIAPLSAIEYLRDADRHLLLPNLAIGACGPVRSVRLVGRAAPEDLRGTVEMTDASATSHVLLKILLKELWSADVECTIGPADFPAVLDRAEAALLIGDDALRLDAGRPPTLNSPVPPMSDLPISASRVSDLPLTSLHVTDLSEAWHRLTGLPMVFAVWAVRREYAQKHPQAVARVAEGLNASLAWSFDNLPEVVVKAPTAGLPDTPGYLTEYFNGLDYGLGRHARAGLTAFAARAHAHGDLARVPELEFVPETLKAAA
ncbi:MAG: menaquinone biosynthesis protein [Actinobacteria bacterium]|nr:menaquinone biosynthesis protein [Actinomycetota bacterium]